MMLQRYPKGVRCGMLRMRRAAAASLPGQIQRGRGRRGLVLLALVSVATAAVLAACGQSTAPPPASPAQARVAINSVELAFVSRAFGSSLPLVVVDLTVENPSAQSVPISRSQFEAADSSGRVYRTSSPRGARICNDPEYVEPALAHADIRPGEAVRGRIAFLIQPGARLATLMWTYDRTEASVALPEAMVVCEP